MRSEPDGLSDLILIIKNVSRSLTYPDFVARLQWSVWDEKPQTVSAFLQKLYAETIVGRQQDNGASNERCNHFAIAAYYSSRSAFMSLEARLKQMEITGLHSYYVFEEQLISGRIDASDEHTFNQI